MYRVGIDVGGTFTDVVLTSEDGRVVSTRKVLNRRDAVARVVSQGVVDSLEGVGGALRDVGWISHGTTITTNVVIERAGARTALVTNKGFRDILEIGTFSRPPDLIYRVFEDKPPPLVPRHLRLEVDCRVSATGEVLRDPDPYEVLRIARLLKEAEVEAVAVCFLYSFLSTHESDVAAIFKDVLGTVPVLTSSDILPEFREFPRMSTTVFGAYIAPTLEKYLHALIARLAEEGINKPLYIFQSNGGVATPEMTLSNPVGTLLSGPAGAVVGGESLARVMTLPNLITMDIGGTSLDVCMIREFHADITTSREIEYAPVAIPTLDVRTVGAGGGSVIRVDSVGRVKVGPESAGATPGPACYGLGGTNATVTDVNLILGYLNPDFFASGEIVLKPELGLAALETCVGKPLGVDAVSAAQGAHTVISNQMAEAIRAMTAARGEDSRDYTLLVFGGGGPLHGAAVAEELGISHVVVPQHPGLFSAFGMSNADFVHDFVQSIHCLASEEAIPLLNDAAKALSARGRAALTDEGIPLSQQRLDLVLDMRYVGQGSEIGVSVDHHPVAGDDLRVTISRFHELHDRLFSYSVASEPVEIINARLRAVGKMSVTHFGRETDSTGALGSHVERDAWFKRAGGFIRVPVFRRDDLGVATSLSGPALVEEPSSTTVVPPGWNAEVDTAGNLVLVTE
jgi:N-methylhydantoinase A